MDAAEDVAAQLAAQAGVPEAALFTTPQPASQPIQMPDLVRLKKMFDDSRTGNQESRKDSELSRDYYDSYQLTLEEKQILRKRGQPEIENNRIKGAINGIMGVVEMGKTDPQAYLRNPDNQQAAAPQSLPQTGPTGPPQLPAAPNAVASSQQPTLDAADVATMTLRYIADTTSFPTTKMDVLENILIEGSGAAIFEFDGQDVIASQIRWEEFFYDPRSRRHDFKDARYMGVAKWMYADMLAAIYQQQGDALQNFMSNGSIDGLGFDLTWEDRPDSILPWFDRQQRRLMVVEMYYQEGQQWNRCVFYAGGTLECGPSPYKDDRGTATNPIEAESAYVDRLNRRYGPVRDMRCIQDEINMRRSKALHETNTRQVQQTDLSAPPVDADVVRDEASRPDGVIPTGWQVVPRSDVIANNLTLLAEAKAEIERYSPNPAILGRQGADASGRAQQVRQQAGLTELARVLGRFRDWEIRCYKQMWARAKAGYTAPKWIRITDDVGAPQYVLINDPVAPPQGLNPQTGQPDLRFGGPQAIRNHIAEMDIDIIVDAVPDTTTLQQEIFQELAQLAQTYGPKNVPFALVIEMSSLPKKRELIQKLEAFQQQQQQIQQQIAGRKFAAEQAQAQADVAETVANAKRADAQAGLYETQTVTTALKGHIDANQALAPLPPGIGNASESIPPNMPPPGGAVALPPPAPTGAPGTSPVN